ncbi:MAG: NADP oxidoreductase [Candidatus Kapabacteria bacterium]|nr:NADP oxidoreductase [Candidatus Kapabacteria bacterium]
MTSNYPVVSIIGIAGTMGSALAARLRRAGFVVHGYDPQLPADGSYLHATAADSVRASTIVILAVPYTVEQQIGGDLADVLSDHIIVSMTNPLTPTLDDVVTPDHDSAAEQLARAIPHGRIVKALNTIGAAALQHDASIMDTFVASDDREAAGVVETMITAIGFRPWYAGKLIYARTLERMTALIIGVSMRYKLSGAVGWSVMHEGL